MNTYSVYLWKTVVLEVQVKAKDADDARDEAMNNFDAGAYDDQWGDAETTRIDAVCEESDKIPDEPTRP